MREAKLGFVTRYHALLCVVDNLRGYAQILGGF
jgi:hypothetical protein